MKHLFAALPLFGLSAALVSGCSGSGNTYYVPATGGGSGGPGAGGDSNSGGSGQSGGAGSGQGGGQTGGTASGGDGGSNAGSGPGGSAGSGGAPQIGCASALTIDDLEDGDSAICPPRIGGWWVTVQDGSAGTVIPSPGTVIMPTPIADRDGSSFAMSFSGSGFDGPDHWAIIALALNDADTYDASVHSGMRFWGRSTSGGNVTLRVTFPTRASTDQMYNGTCVPVGAIDCGDHYTAYRTLTNVWQQYEIYFANDLAQVGWGVPVAKDLAYAYGIEFQYQTYDNAEAGTFAFIVDDLTFY